MKVLHVSDWHLGRFCGPESRAADHDAVLAEILSIAREHRPDLILHTGDLFDVARPGVEDMQRGIQALQDLATVAPTAVVAGNHDSPALFRLFQLILSGPGSALGATALGTARLTFIDRPRPGEAGLLTVAVDTPTGQQRLRLASLPFIRDGRIADSMEDPAKWMTNYADRIRQMEETLGVALRARYDGTRDVNLFAAHLHVAGATWSHSERPLTVSDSYASHVEAMPEVSYAAFGHIHKPQDLPGLQTGTYAGSPLQLDFGEEDETKRVVVVEADPGRSARVQSVPLAAGRRLRSFRGTLEQLEAQAATWGNEIGRVVVETPTSTPGLPERVRTLLDRATLLRVDEVPADAKLALLIEGDPGEALVEPSLEELFTQFLGTHATSGVPAAKVAAAFGPLLASGNLEELAPPGEDALLDRLGEVANTAHGLALAPDARPAQNA